MDLRAFSSVIRARWRTVILTLLAASALTALAVLRTPEMYTASTALYVSVQSDTASAAEVGQGSNAAQQKTRPFADVVTSQGVLQPVIDELGLDDSVESLASRVSASTAQNSVIITIDATDADPGEAARLANAVGESFRTLVTDRLERPVGGGDSLVRIETIDAATPPSSPSAPQTTVYVSLGLACGLVAGLALAFLQNALDTRVRTSHDVEEVTRAPVLGEIGWDPGAAKSPLLVQGDPKSLRAESFRALRTNLLFLDLDSTKKKSFVVTSATPAEGKTTSTANLAIALAEAGHRVVLLDADLRRPRLATIMGLEGAVGLTDLLIGRVEVEDVAQPWGRAGLTVIPAGRTPPNPSEMLGSQAMRTLVSTLEASFDYVLIDSPPLLPVTDAAVLSKLTSGALVVTAAHRTRRPQLERALAALDAIGAPVLGVVLTMVKSSHRSGYGYGYGYGYGVEEPRRSSRRRRAEARADRIRAQAAT